MFRKETELKYYLIKMFKNSGQITYFCVTAEPPIGNTVSPIFKQI